MISDYHIDEPFLFNPLKHHLGYIKGFTDQKTDNTASDIPGLRRELNHLGNSVMDVYRGSLSTNSIIAEVKQFLSKKNILETASFRQWAGIDSKSFRTISLSDDSVWTIRYHDNRYRYVHIFPARNSQHTFRVKSNTIKSAVIYNILSGKDSVTAFDLNKGRLILGLSPIKDIIDVEAIMEMIEMLRNYDY